ncbi:hypothetical protein BH23ACT12_BH23ACT12_09560 [soil metagenome]
MKTTRAVAKFVTITAFVAAGALVTGATAGSPGTTTAAEAAEAPQTAHSDPQFSIETTNPEPAQAGPNAPPVAPPVPELARPPAAPPQVAAPPAGSRALRTGDSGPEVRALETRLKELGYDPGRADGTFDQYTRFAVIAFQKVADLNIDGLAGPAVLGALDNPPAPSILVPDGAPNRVEVNLGRQLMTVYRDGNPALITHVSTGNNETFCSSGRCRQAVTPQGSYKFFRRVSGWRTAELGRIYNPVYFTDDGVAVHGFASVPLYPASHGCVRIPMHTADLFPELVQTGTDIHVIG